MITINLNQFKELLKEPTDFTHPMKINLANKGETKDLYSFLEKQNIPLVNTIKAQLSEYLEIHTKYHKKTKESFTDFETNINDSNTEVTGELIFFGWEKKAVFNILDEHMFYELITWRNKEKITNEEQEILATKRIGIIGTSVGSFTCRILAKLGFKNFNIAEPKNMKPSNAPRMYQDSLRNYSRHKLRPLTESLYEFNPFLNIKPYYDGVNENNIDDFFHINNQKIDILVDAADDGKVKIMMRDYCAENKIPLVTGFDEKGALIIERYDKPELLIESKVTHTIENLEKLKIDSPQEYVYKLLDFFPGGITNISERQKQTLTMINNNSRGGFSQLAWEASLFASYVSKSVLDIALGKPIHGVRLFDLDKMISKEMLNNRPYKI